MRYVLVALLALAGCNPEEAVVLYPPLSPEPIQKSYAPDSVLKYLPQLGDVNQVRQYPFGATGKPATSLRLMEFTENNGSISYKTVFQYDPTGRLSQWTCYNQDGFIWSRQTYRYDEGGKVEVKTDFNKDVPRVSYGIQITTNDLLPVYTSLFEPVANHSSRVMRTEVVEEMPLRILQPGTTLSRLSFGTDGRLARQDVLYRHGVDETITSSSIFKWNEKGNTDFIHNVSFNNSNVSYYTYDDKPNPFRISGDITLFKNLLPSGWAGISSANNVVSMEVVSIAGVHEKLDYRYEYRPDGYPTTMKVYRNGELISTRTFKYNE
ncbi:hypothetical protein GCM10027275_16750 [Rhabdobacter roseus]